MPRKERKDLVITHNLLKHFIVMSFILAPAIAFENVTYGDEVELEDANSEFAENNSEYAKVNITQEYAQISGVETKYSITIVNTGTIEAERLSLNLSLPQNMSETSPIEVIPRRDIKYNITGNRINITDLGNLNTGEAIIIDLLLKHEIKPEVELGDVTTEVNYFALYERKAVQSHSATKREEGFSDNP